MCSMHDYVTHKIPIATSNRQKAGTSNHHLINQKAKNKTVAIIAKFSFAHSHPYSVLCCYRFSHSPFHSPFLKPFTEFNYNIS